MSDVLKEYNKGRDDIRFFEFKLHLSYIKIMLNIVYTATSASPCMKRKVF